MKNLLIVDDDETYLSTITMEAELSGFNVITAKDGEEAIQKAQSEAPDAILLDIVMPRRSGLTVLSTISKMEPLKKIPIIVTSNLSTPENKTYAVELGATKFMTKSEYTPSAIIAEVKKILG